MMASIRRCSICLPGFAKVARPNSAPQSEQNDSSATRRRGLQGSSPAQA